MFDLIRDTSVDKLKFMATNKKRHRGFKVIRVD